MHRNARGFCALTLYPSALLNSVMSSSSFLAVSLGYFSTVYSIMSSANSDSCTFFQFGFLYFYSLIAMLRTFPTILNKSGESGCPCLVPDLEEIISTFLS